MGTFIYYKIKSNMKFILAALVASASAHVKGYPAFDKEHADCALHVDVEGTCEEVYKVFSDLDHYTDSTGGKYKTVERKENVSVWVKRETPTKHYIDDVLFELGS